VIRQRRPLSRKTPLRRTSKLRPRSKTKKRKPRDMAYMAWIKTLRCMGAMPHKCEGASEAHHAGVRGLGQKAPDRTCIPLCPPAHRAWHDGGDAFKGMGRVSKRAFADTIIKSLNALYESGYVQQPKPSSEGGR